MPMLDHTESARTLAKRAAHKKQAIKAGSQPPKPTPWPYEVEQSGWFKSHEAIRADLRDTLAVIARMRTAKALEDWEVPTLRRWWAHFDAFIREHHHLEEDRLFPLVATRAELPLRLADDHAELERLLVVAEAALGACTEQAGLPYVEAAVRAVSDHMLPHLREEEADVMPALHAKFGHGEFSKFEGKFAAADFQWFSLPHLYRPMPAADRRPHALHVFGIPAPVYDYLLARNMARFDKGPGADIQRLLGEHGQEEAAMGRCM
mmetsp:Transcript_13495/g.45720  ORF Transcript_13495/g.45720 Transcript_13495/m.45720 type:complete len:263 (+) Transcript_13495:63-851(+)